MSLQTISSRLLQRLDFHSLLHLRGNLGAMAMLHKIEKGIL